MSEETAQVVDVDEHGVWVEAHQVSACQQCEARQGCGHRALSEAKPSATSARAKRLWVASDMALTVGDWVVLSLPSGSLAISALVMYVTPLLGLIAGAALGVWLDALFLHASGVEWYSLIFSAVGLGLGFSSARYFSYRNKSAWQPTIIKKLHNEDIV